MNREERIKSLLALLEQRIVVLDGAMGTMIQSYGLGEDDYRGERFADWQSDLKGNNDLLTITRPQVIREIHTAFLEAGADIIETNTFNSNAPSMADYGMEAMVSELNLAAARLARECADAHAEQVGSPRYVAGVLGPTNRTASISPDVNDPGYRNIRFADLAATYEEAARALIEGGADFAELAATHSKCPSGRNGGDLGSFGPGEMVKEFDTVVFNEAVGQVHGPVKTQFGYHLLEITSRDD